MMVRRAARNARAALRCGDMMGRLTADVIRAGLSYRLN
jgi:hypothetical protein